jgi:tetratricopeptide (TPR) repeat protein
MAALLMAALCLLAGAVPVPAQDAGLEEFARALVDHPALAAGDTDAHCLALLELVAREPGHPLADAALGVVQLRQSALHDPAALAAALEALPAAGLAPAAARRLGLLKGAARVARAPLDTLVADQWPDHLSRSFVLAPLAPLDHPLAFRTPLAALTAPGFDRAHAGAAGAHGPAGEVYWRSLQRSPLQRTLQPSEAVTATGGQALSAFLFDVPGGGPAFLELDVRARGQPASHALSINGEAPVIVDRLATPGPAVMHYGVSLRDGRNSVLLQTALDQRAQIALRVLGPDGRPRQVSPVATLGEAARPLGKRTDGRPPVTAPETGEDVLAKLPARGPDTEALLGLLLFHSDREPDGLAHVRRALELAPDRTGLRALLAELSGRAGYLPTSWKRSHKRRLAEEVLAAEPLRADMALVVYGILADEDREEEAIAGLTALAEALPEQPDVQLALADVYGRLGMDVAAEAALARALEIAPKSPRVLTERAQVYDAHGQSTRAAELRLAALRAGGASGTGLRNAADRFLAVGEAERALDLMREGVQRDDDRAARADLGKLLLALERFDEADAVQADLAARYPEWERPWMARADIALRRGDFEGELAALRAALARRPSLREARERLFALTGADDTRDYFAREAADADAVMAVYDDAGQVDSVVHVLDHAVVRVHEDGATETLTQDVWRVRDLAGCEQMGRMRPDGDVLRLAVIKPDGTEYEPVRAGGYVMPNLKPGDFVVSERRSRAGAPGNGVVRPGSWTFASTEFAVGRSRYVIAVPDALGLRLVQRQFDGEYAQEPWGASVVHRFETQARARVLPEPHTPPATWFLPWVEFGMDADTDAILAGLAAGLVEPTRVTPEVRAAAEGALSGAAGDSARARALHAFVNETLDQRGWGSATAGLLEREGNATYLYSALLTAAQVPHELLWSRNISPESDPEPDPAFVEGNYWRRKLLVLVEPRDGAPAFCDMDNKMLPYGELLGEAPGAPAVALPSQRLLALPDLPLSERPTLNTRMSIAVALDGSASVDATLAFQAAPAWVLKEPVREIPTAFRKNWVTQMLAQIVPGVDVGDYAIPGLDEADQPLEIHGQGKVPTFLDDDGESLSCKLPFPQLGLAAQLAGGEGPRRLPFFLDEPVVQSSTIRVQLEEGLSATSLPAGLAEEILGGRYELLVEPDGERGLTIRRSVALPPFVIPASGHAAFAAFCQRVDEAERGVLRFTRDVQ